MFSQGFTYKQLFSLIHTGSRWAKIEKKSSQRAVNDKGLSLPIVPLSLSFFLHHSFLTKQRGLCEGESNLSGLSCSKPG